MEKLVEKLKEIGFNSYESKVYLALLKKYPATGYEISKLANIPQARTYDTLKVLEQKKIVISANKKPVEYYPVQPKEILKNYKKKMISTIDYLTEQLPEVKNAKSYPILSLNKTEDIILKIKEIIQNAQKNIYLEIWSQDFTSFEEDLKNAYNNNVEIRIVGYNNLKSSVGLIYQHPFPKATEASHNGRIIAICADNKVSAFGVISSDDATNVLFSQDKNIVIMTTEFITHDMMLLDVQSNLLDEMKYHYGKGLKHLHDKILGNDNLYNTVK